MDFLKCTPARCTRTVGPASSRVTDGPYWAQSMVQRARGIRTQDHGRLGAGLGAQTARPPASVPCMSSSGPARFLGVDRGPATSIALQATTLFSLCSHSIQILSWSFRRGELNWLHPGVWVSAPGGVGTSVCGCCHKLPPTRGLKRQKSSARGSVSEGGRGLLGSHGPGPCSPHPFPDPDPPASPVPALPRQD